MLAKDFIYRPCLRQILFPSFLVYVLPLASSICVMCLSETILYNCKHTKLMTQQQLFSHPANLVYLGWDILEYLLCHPFQKCTSYKSQSRSYCLHNYTLLFNLNKLKLIQAPILPDWQKFNLSHHLGFPKYILFQNHTWIKQALQRVCGRGRRGEDP